MDDRCRDPGGWRIESSLLSLPGYRRLLDASATVEAFDPYRYDQLLVGQLTKGYRQLVDEAEAEVETLSVEEAHRVLADGSRLIVDIRDVRELSREGKIPGAFHAPRGMLEFWVDPESPYHHAALSEADELLLYCGSGWRSALAASTLQGMGMTNVAHIGGGFSGWVEAGYEVEKKE